MTIEFDTGSVEQTELIGSKIGTVLEPGDVIALDGDLGAGKTAFTRGLGSGMDIKGHVSSPTFTIVNEYEGGRLPLFHFDTYRLSGSDDFLAAGLDEYFYRDGVCIIEWSEVISDLLPSNTVYIKIKGNGDIRHFEISGTDEQIEKIREAIGKC